MARELKEVVATHVSIVKKGANGKKFLITKSAEKGKENLEIVVNKFLVEKDNPEKTVYGVVYAPNEVDLQGDFMSADTIEKMAETFMENFQNIDKNHDYTSEIGSVLQSYIAPQDVEIAGEVVTKGTWLLKTRVTDEVWSDIEKGVFTGYSIGGYCMATEETEKSIKDKLYEVTKGLFGSTVIEKDFDTMLKNKLNTDIWAVLNIFWSAVNEDDWNAINNADAKERFLKDIDQLKAHVESMTFELESVNKEQKEGGSEMNPEEIKKSFEELNKEFKESVEKQMAEVNKGIEELKETAKLICDAFATQKSFNENVEKALTSRMTAIGSTGAGSLEKEKQVNVGMGELGR